MTAPAPGALELTLVSGSEAQTEAYAGIFARCLRPAVFVLRGDLGAGKTCFARGFVAALAGGSDVVVQSPTYALARSYRTTPVVHHLDLYRLGDDASAPGAAEELGLVDLVTDESAHALVEWPRGIDDVVAPARLVSVDIGMGGGTDERELKMTVPLGLLIDRVEVLRALSVVRR